MLYIFTCPTKDCENHKNPVYMLDVVNPIHCSLCQVDADAEAQDA